MHTTHQKGEIAFLKCSLRAAEQGLILSRPTTESRYDAILDENGNLKRIQVKYAGGDENTAVADFRKKSTSASAETRTYSSIEIDLMMVYIASIDKVLKFGPDIFEGKQAIRIRVTPTKNCQKMGIIMAFDYIW